MIQTISSLSQNLLCIVLCNFHQLFYYEPFLWFHETENDPGVLMGTRLSRSDMFTNHQTTKPSNHFRLDHSQLHVLANCSGLNKNIPPLPRRLFDCLVPSLWCSLGRFGKNGLNCRKHDSITVGEGFRAYSFTQLPVCSLYFVLWFKV